MWDFTTLHRIIVTMFRETACLVHIESVEGKVRPKKTILYYTKDRSLVCYGKECGSHYYLEDHHREKHSAASEGGAQ